MSYQEDNSRLLYKIIARYFIQKILWYSIGTQTYYIIGFYDWEFITKGTYWKSDLWKIWFADSQQSTNHQLFVRVLWERRDVQWITPTMNSFWFVVENNWRRRQLLEVSTIKWDRVTSLIQLLKFQLILNWLLGSISIIAYCLQQL